MRFFFTKKKKKPKKLTTCQEAQRSSVLCFTGDADTREKLCFHTTELQPLDSVSWGLWSLEKQRGREKKTKHTQKKKKKTWPGFKNNKSGISISAFKWQKRWRENSSIKRRRRRAPLSSSRCRNTNVSLACAVCLIVRQEARLCIHRALLLFFFFF